MEVVPEELAAARDQVGQNQVHLCLTRHLKCNHLLQLDKRSKERAVEQPISVMFFYACVG
ncbi:Uncharacterised protein [Proteus mirabilis]|uniref:Uncharacterized protein n=1 Tax=Proteus mirabilis TaxID=584 RepID=A0A379GFF1_PROMI|nr:Uncharacterised protein [Proteus mirabilis]